MPIVHEQHMQHEAGVALLQREDWSACTQGCSGLQTVASKTASLTLLRACRSEMSTSCNRVGSVHVLCMGRWKLGSTVVAFVFQHAALGTLCRAIARLSSWCTVTTMGKQPFCKLRKAGHWARNGILLAGVLC